MKITKASEECPRQMPPSGKLKSENVKEIDFKTSSEVQTKKQNIARNFYV